MATGPQKMRLDVLLCERHLADSRQRAQSLILAGKVLVNGQKVTKAGTAIDAEAQVELIGNTIPYVSRAGLKLEAALQRWAIDPSGLVALDIGSSTGGFTDCLLKKGAARVHAIDVGTNQLDWKLRNDPRVHSMENTNARYMTFEQIGEQVDFICVDVSFISAKLILPTLTQFCKKGTHLVLLIKPQFEAGRHQVGKGGIVRDESVRQSVVVDLQRAVAEAGFHDLDVFPSPVLGAEGNQEYLLHGAYEA